jgi:type II secretory pathway component PulF
MMSMFTYTALDAEGRRTTGTVPADNRAAALEVVLGRGLHPLSVEAAGSGAVVEQRGSLIRGEPGKEGKLSQAVVEASTRELSNLLAGGVPLSRALSLLRREAATPMAKTIWSAVHDDVIGGMPLAEALAKWPRTFSPIYIAMVRAGEAGGFLDVVLQQIADFRQREQELLGRVKAALVYPLVLAGLAVVVLIFLMTYFIPRFSGIFAEFGSALPWLTRMIVGASELVVRYGLVVLVAGVVGVVLARRALTTESGRRAMEQAILKTPGVGRVVARFALVRFCRMLGTLLGAGVPLVASLRVAREAIGNQVLSDAVSHATEEVQRGESLARSLSGAPQLFPASVVEMVAVAEETGRLDKELIRLAGAYETELDRQLRMLVSLAEPLLLIVMAAIIGTVVVGMLLPVFTLQDMIQ